MEIIRPAAVESQPSGVRRAQQIRIVSIVLRDDEPASRMHPLRDLREDVLRRVVDNCVRRIEAETVDVKLAHPVECVFAKEIPYRRLFVIQPDAPWRLMFGIEIAAVVAAEVVSVRTEMVVDNVEDDGEAARMRSINERAEIIRLTVGA